MENEQEVIKLSEIILNGCDTAQDAIDYCLDRRVESIINDIPPEPWVEYTLRDVEHIWKNLKNVRNADTQ